MNKEHMDIVELWKAKNQIWGCNERKEGFENNEKIEFNARIYKKGKEDILIIIEELINSIDNK